MVFIEPAEKLIRVRNFDLAEASKRQQVRIARYDDAGARLGRAFQDSIILEIVRGHFYTLLGLDEAGHVFNLSYQSVDTFHRKLKLLAPENSLDLIQDIVRNGNPDQAFDSQVQNFARLAPKQHRRYKNVGIENDPRLFDFLF